MNLKRHPSWLNLKHCIRKEWERMVITLSGFLAFAIAGTAYMPGQLRILFLVGALVAAWYLLHFLIGKGHWHHSELLRDLRQRSEHITWIYGVAYQRIPFGFFFSERYRIFIGFDNGVQHDVLVPTHQYKAIMLLLQRMSPGATVGWNKEYQAEFDKNPASLRRDQGSKAR